MSNVRFQLDTYSLPTFIADIEPAPNTDVHKMIETVTLEYDNGAGSLTTVGPLNLVWVPSNTHIAVPPAPAPLQGAKSEYYYGNSFRQYCDLINTCMASLNTSLITAVRGSTLSGMEAPYFIWNESNQTAELLAEEEFYNSSRSAHVNIYFNRALYPKFTSLPPEKNFFGTDGKIYKIIVKDDYSTKLVLLDLGTDTLFIKTPQEYSTIANWSPVASIVFTSNTLPIVQTQLSEPLVYNSGQLLNVNIPQNFAPVISDMCTNDLCYKPNLSYVPSAQYRFIDLIGNNDLTNIEVSVYWKSKNGLLIPFFLQSGATASIKILFQLKE